MTRIEEFDAFYLQSRDRVLAASFALSGDVATARTAAIHGFSRAWRNWDRVGNGDAESYVRDEASKSFSVSRRRLTRSHHRKVSSVDAALMRALNRLTFDQRRLVVLFTVIGIDLESATRETGIEEQVAFEQTSMALDKLENDLKISIIELEKRLADLGSATAGVKMPAPAEIRSGARKGGRRNLVIAMTAAVVALVVGGVVATNGPATARLVGLPDRHTFSDKEPNYIFNSRQLSLENLLSVRQVSSLAPDKKWELEGASTDIAEKTPYSTCPTERFADPDPADVFVGTYITTDNTQRVAQSIEVSRSTSAAESSYGVLVNWYSNCSHPRTRLIDSYTVDQPFGTVHILRLQSYRDPARFMTVGISQSGDVTNTLVWEVNGTEPTDLSAFVGLLNTSTAKVCQDSGGDCTTDANAKAALPPASTSDPAFLNSADLPPLGDLDEAWNATLSVPNSSSNPASTPCDTTVLANSGFANSRYRVINMPDATTLPKDYGVVQSVATAPDDASAAAFIASVTDAVNNCSDSGIAVTVSDETPISGDGYIGTSWQVTLALSDTEQASYRMGVVQRGPYVTEVVLPPAGQYTMTNDDFVAVMNRAGERLAYAS